MVGAVLLLGGVRMLPVPGVVVLRAGRERRPALRGRVHVQVRLHVRGVRGRVGGSEAGGAVALLAGLAGLAGLGGPARRVVVVLASVLRVRRRLVHRVERHGAAGERRLGAHNFVITQRQQWVS